MPTRITAVRFHRVVEHEAAVSFRWQVDGGHHGETDRLTMIEWLEQGGEVVIGEGHEQARVGVVKIPGMVPYIQAHVDGQWCDRLLGLPRF
jgi:hypothetical protein